jgi:hypothetical protein
LVETSTFSPSSSSAASLSLPPKIQKEESTSPAPATPASSNRCFLRVASLLPISPVTGETFSASSSGPSRVRRVREKMSASAI